MSRRFDNSSTLWPAAGISPQVRFIVFAATALAVFAGGLYFWPTPIRGYVFEAELDGRAEDAGGNAAVLARPQQSVREAVLSPQVVKAALEQAGPPPGVKRTESGPFPSDAEVAYVARKLYVENPPTPGPQAARLAVGFTSLDSDWGSTLLNHLLRQAVIELDQRAEAAIAERKASKEDSPLALAMRREEAALAALDGFLNRHFDKLNEESRPANQREQRQINPNWQILQDRLVAERARLEQLLLDRLPEHPQAKEAAARIEAIQRQFNETPKFQGEKPDSYENNHAATRRAIKETVQPAQFSDDAQSGLCGLHHASSNSASDEYERRLRELTDARVARRLAERELALRSHSESAQASSPIVRGTIVANARLVQTLREASSIGRLTVLALSSIFAGACLAAMLRFPPTSRVYASAAEVEADLSVPVVAVVPVPNSSAVSLSR